MTVKPRRKCGKCGRSTSNGESRTLGSFGYETWVCATCIPEIRRATRKGPGYGLQDRPGSGVTARKDDVSQYQASMFDSSDLYVHRDVDHA